MTAAITSTGRLLAIGLLLSTLAAQSPADVLDGIHAMRATLAAAAEAGDLPAAQPAAATRYTELLLQLRASAANTHSPQLALAHIQLSYCADGIFPGQPETVRLLAELDGILRSRPGPPHGRSQLLNRWTRIEMDSRIERTHLDDWDRLVQDFSGPKRFWIGCEAARSFITNCGRPLRAEQLLTKLLDEIERVPEWDEAERLALVRDRDLWITDSARPRAASRTDTVGQLLVLRGYAREQVGRLMPAVEDLLAAKPHLEASQNEHRALNCEQNLASIWWQMGCHDLAFATADAVQQRYQQRSDANGQLAMRKVKAQVHVGRGEWVKALQLLAGIVREPCVDGETNCDALTSYMEALLHVPPSQAGRVAFDEQLRRVREFCGADREQLMLWRAELLLAERTIREDPAAARRILDAAKEPLDLHRHLPLQVRRRVLCGDSWLASDPRKALLEYEAAAELLGKAMASERLWRIDGATAQFAQQFHAIVSGAYEAVRVLLADDPSREPWIDRLYALVQQFHGFESLCRLLADRSAWTPDSPQEQQELESLTQAVRDAEASYEALRSVGTAMDPDRRRKLAEVERRIGDCEQRLQLARAKSGGLPGQVQSGSAQAVQQCLDKGELLVECVETPGCAFAFALTRTGCELQPLPRDDAWQEAISRLRAWDPLDSRRDVTEIPELWDCSERLLDADGWLGQRLAGPGITRLLWSPEGSFSCVPLHALPYQGKPLLATLPITHAISGSWLQQQRARARPPRVPSEMRLLALGNPRYDAAAVRELVLRSLVGGGAFPCLPATAGEVLRVAEWFADDAVKARLDERLANNPEAWDGELPGPRLRILLGACASESGLVSALESARDEGWDVLHLACHGEGNHAAPFRSFLALSPDGDAAQQGAPSLLRLPELARLRGDFELVTLSACQTSVGTDRGHDGVAGLAWAAQLAGARRVLATMWSVPDAPTSELVVEFYQHWLKGGMSCSDALAAMQRAAIGKRPVRVWAPFVLWGEAR